MADHVPPAAFSSPVWKLSEARAKLSEVVRLAVAGQPQRITVNGRDAVVVVATREFERLRAPSGAPNLHQLLSRSPLSRLEFEHGPIAGPVRDADN